MNDIAKNKPDYLGHRRRLKKRFMLNEGLDAWQEYEVLELVLSYALPRKDVKPIAKELLRRFKSFSGVLDAKVDELSTVAGISEHTALLLRLIRDCSKHYAYDQLKTQEVISSPALAVEYLKTALRGEKNEVFHVLFLDKAHHVIAAETLHRGTVDRSVVYPRVVVERALHHHAVSIIIAHNHPGGTLSASTQDTEMTKSVRQALETVDMVLLDHVIITKAGSLSFKEQGLL